MSTPEVHLLVDELFSSELHAQRVLSLSNATVGVIEAGTLEIRAIGHGLALAKQLKWSQTVKQVEWLIGNPALGACAADVLTLVVGHGVRLALLGVVPGVFAA